MRRKQDSSGGGYAVSTRSGERNGVRNLEAIEEHDPIGPSRSRVGALIMASFGGACIVFGALLLMRSPQGEAVKPTDPLSDLVQAAKHDVPGKGENLAAADVTFPSVLTDQNNPTTAMEVVRSRRGGDINTDQLPRAPTMFDGPPPATDVLPVVPLPAQDMIGSTPTAQVAPADKLHNIANGVTQETDGKMADAGKPGGYQLQVSSFKKTADAEAFATALRRRGHKAYVQKAHVKGRGVWYRVRIGPFRYKRSADIYRQDFEAKERMVTFIVNPPRTRIRIEPAQ